MLSRSSVRHLLVLCLVLTAMVRGSLASAQALTTLTRDYDLVSDNGLFHVSQQDGRWADFNMKADPTITIGQCGCLLSTVSTVLMNMGRMLPWFPVGYIGGGGSAFDFNPRYLDLFFTYGVSPNLPIAPSQLGWGFKNGPSGSCGLTPMLLAMQTLANDGLGRAVGVTAVYHQGFGAAEKAIVNRNLIAGVPTIFAYREKNSMVANHAMLFAGWDNREHAYKILDPMAERVNFNQLTIPVMREDMAPGGNPAVGPFSYQEFENRVTGIIEITPGGFDIGASFVFGDDPSPIEILMTGPDGRRTGLDVRNGALHAENPTASYWNIGPWLDPLGELPEVTTPRFVSFPHAPAGTYRFTVTGVADGPLHLSADRLLGTTRTVLGAWEGTIAAGEVRKYEMRFFRGNGSTATQVSNFTPEAKAGPDVSTRTGLIAAIDARASFDIDGTIASYAWDFGDGTTGTGAQPQHSYATPGDYTATLTVTDNNGATATDTIEAHVILAQARPTAAITGPYIGFATSELGEWPVIIQGYRSSDPNGDTLTFRWDFGDGSPIETTTTVYAAHTYATGTYTVTLVANDGQDDSLPVTTVAEIVKAPAAHPFSSVGAQISPTCSAAGDPVTLTLGEFATFDWWDAGLSGPYRQTAPNHLPLGTFDPDGMLTLFMEGGWEGTFPFHVTMLGAGRYTAQITFPAPALAPGQHAVMYGEGESIPFRIGCPQPLNNRPVAHAGGPYTAQAGVPVTLDGSESVDPEGEELISYEWNFGDGQFGEGVHPVHVYAQPGTYVVTLRVNDDGLYSIVRAGSHTFGKVVVEGSGSSDLTPPVTTAVRTPAAPVSGWHTGDVTVALTAVDNPGGSGVRDISTVLSGASDGTATAPGDATGVVVSTEGTSTLTFHATDNAGNVEADQAVTLRIDRTAPAVSGLPANRCPIWPFNQKLLTIADLGITDALSGVVADSIRITASSDWTDGAGDPRTPPAVVISGTTVRLRAPRDGMGYGRTFTVTVTATDVAGNTVRAQGGCFMPHDRRSAAAAGVPFKPVPSLQPALPKPR